MPARLTEVCHDCLSCVIIRLPPFRFNGASKSIVCDEDSCFRELARYIHLNPLRVKLVKNMSELERYRWCGHSVLMGRIKHSWQDREYVLAWFGDKEVQAKKDYLLTNNTNFSKIGNLLSHGHDMDYIARHYHMDLALVWALRLDRIG